jgi:hypothetical protein
MYQDYLDAIMKHYEQKKLNNELSLRLLNPTPAKIKDECVAVYQSRLMERDLKMLISFMEVREGADVLKAIKKGRDKFKPLDNYLKNATEKTEDRNIELLGWLLDFEPRPYDDRYDYKKDVPPTTKKTLAKPPEDPTKKEAYGKAVNPVELTTTAIQPEPINAEQVGPKRPTLIKKLGFIAGSLIIASGLIAAVIFNNKDNKGCMIWVGDHYERVSCDSSGGMGLVLGLDANSVRHLRRITRPDTLTEKDIGKVWYRKRGADSLDFYTTGGRDPVDPNLDLKRLTVYIFEKYLRKKNLIDSSGAR